MRRFDAGVRKTPAAIIRASVARITSFVETHTTP